MKQITEDYCSYEIAVLLKEKGFDEPYCNCYLLLDKGGYTEVEMSDECHQGERYDSESSSWKFGTLLLRPTHQMVLKWLREIYHCHVVIEYVFKADAKLTNDYASYCFSVENANTFIEFTQDEWYDTYEQAVEAALKYTLENLI